MQIGLSCSYALLELGVLRTEIMHTSYALGRGTLLAAPGSVSLARAARVAALADRALRAISTEDEAHC